MVPLRWGRRIGRGAAGGGRDGAVAEARMEPRRVSTSGRCSDCSSLATVAGPPSSDGSLLQLVQLGIVDTHVVGDRVGSCGLCFDSHEPAKLAGLVTWQPSPLEDSDGCVGCAPVAGPRRAGGDGWMGGCRFGWRTWALPWPASDTAPEAHGGMVSPPVRSVRGECSRGRAGVAGGCPRARRRYEKPRHRSSGLGVTRCAQVRSG